MGKIKSEVVSITPNMARTMLANQQNFRKGESSARIERYARMMKVGKWKVGPPIMMGESEELYDGFHRLNAVINANMTISFVVLSGVPANALTAIDTGWGRSAGVQLNASGLIQDRAAGRASVMRAMHAGSLHKCPYTQVHPTETPELYRIYQRAVDFVFKCFPSAQRGFTRAPILAAWGRAFLACHGDADRLELAAKKYTTLEFQAGDEALRLLVKFSSQSNGSGDRANQAELYMKSANALRAWLNGETPIKLRVPANDPFPIPVRYKTRIAALGFQEAS